MPNLPKKPCRKCGKPTGGGYCDDCKPTAYNPQKAYNAKRDPATTRLYKTARWRGVRKNELIKNAMRHGCSHPVCEECGRVIYNHSEAEVDHIEPHRGDVESFWHGARQVLCIWCHSVKTRRGL